MDRDRTEVLPAPMDLLEFCRDAGSGRTSYRLGGRDVTRGDRLEVLTPLGWLPGTFEWTGSAFNWPRLLAPYEDNPDAFLMIVLPAGFRCRWSVD